MHKSIYKSSLINLTIYQESLDAELKDEAPSHYHGQYQLVICIDQAIEYFIHSSKIILHKNEAMLLNPHQIHSTKPVGGKAKYLCISFDRDLFHPLIIELISQNTIDKTYFFPLVYSLDHHWQEEINQICEQSDEFMRNWQLINFISTLTYQMINNSTGGQPTNHKIKKNKYEDHFIKALNYIYKNYAENILIDDVAGAAYINKNLCTEIFNYYTDMTPMQYINQYRLIQSKNLVINSDMAITLIGESVGFRNTSYFIRKFKEYYHLTPLQYRFQFGRQGGDDYQ